MITKLDLDTVNKSIKELIEKAYIVYHYDKALFQGVVHSVHNELEREEISHDALLAIPSQRGAGKLGSSGK